MALTYTDRINAARNNQSSLSGQVMFALVLHAQWQLNPENAEHPAVTPEKQILARSVLANPDSYAWRFGASVIVHPDFDAITDLSQIADNAVQGKVEALYGLFAPAPAPEA